MIYLLLSVLASVLVVSYFKLFERFEVEVLPAIVVNYITCTVMGNLMSDHPIILTPFYQQPWFPYTLVLGFLFITIFYCIAQTAQKVGVSISMVAAKLSVAVPVLYAVIIHHEGLGVYKTLGIALSLTAVYFISSIQTNNNTSKYWYLPLLVFAGSGCIDTLLTIINKQFIPPADTNSVLSVVFLTAYVLGMLLLLMMRIQISLKSILWGLALGIPNYFSMYFLLKTLQSFKESSIALPLNNIGILMTTALVGWLFFKEQLHAKKIIGLTLAILSIVILSLYQ